MAEQARSLLLQAIDALVENREFLLSQMAAAIENPSLGGHGGASDRLFGCAGQKAVLKRDLFESVPLGGKSCDAGERLVEL